MDTTSQDSSNGPDPDPDNLIASHEKKMAEEKLKMSLAGAVPKQTPTEASESALEQRNVMTKEEYEKLMDEVTDKYPQFDTIMKNIEKTPHLVRTTAFRIPEKQVLPPSLVKMRQEAADIRKSLKRPRTVATRHDKTRESSPDNNNVDTVEVSPEHDELFAKILQSKRQERIDRELQQLSDKFQQWDISKGAPPVSRQPPVKKPAPTQMSDQAKQLKSDIDTNKLLMEQAQLMTNIVQTLGTPAAQAQLNEIKKKAIEHAEKAIKIKTETSQQEEQMKRSAALTEKYQRTAKLPPKVPKLMTPIVYLPKDVEAACGTYDPEDAKADFAKIWDNVLYMGKDNGYQTEDYLRALGYVLKGDAKDVYNQCRANGDDLEDILQRLTNAYAKQRTVTEDRRALENFIRKPAEPLLQCMSRCDIQIDKLQPFHSPEAWPAVREFFKRMALLQVVSKQTKRKILFMEDDLIKSTGTPCDINRLISYADTYEVRHDEVPQSEIKTAFHCATAEPIQRRDPQIKKMSQQIKQLKEDLSLMTNKVTAFYASTSDVHMTDTAVRPNKRPRQEDQSTKPNLSPRPPPQEARRQPPSSDELRRRNESRYRNQSAENKYSNNKPYKSDYSQSKPANKDSDRFKPETYNMTYEQFKAKQRAKYEEYNRNHNSNYKRDYDKSRDYKQLDYNKPNYNRDYYDRGRSYDRYNQPYYDNRSKSYENRSLYRKDDDRSQRRDYRSTSQDRYPQRRDYRSSSRDRYNQQRENRHYNFSDYERYIVPDKSRSTSIVPYRTPPTEVKQEGSGNIIFNMEGRPIQLIPESEFRKQLRNSEN